MSARSQTGVEALTILADLLSKGLDARRFSERLSTAGFIVVPKPYKKPARRGNEIDCWIGKSHSAKLVG